MEPAGVTAPLGAAATDNVPLHLATDKAEVAAATGGPAAQAPASATSSEQRRRIGVSSEISEQGARCHLG